MRSRSLLAGLAAVLCTSAATGCATTPPPANPMTTVPASAASGYPADISTQLCTAGLHPVFVDAPPISHAERNVNGYAAATVSPGPTTQVTSGSTVQIRLVISVNAGGPWPEPPRESVVPNVVGLDINTGIATLTAFGLVVDVTTETPTGSMLITAHRPGAGATALRGSSAAVTAGAPNSEGCPLAG